MHPIYLSNCISFKEDDCFDEKSVYRHYFIDNLFFKSVIYIVIVTKDRKHELNFCSIKNYNQKIFFLFC